jgi:hypothetical protein
VSWEASEGRGEKNQEAETDYILHCPPQTNQIKNNLEILTKGKRITLYKARSDSLL